MKRRVEVLRFDVKKPKFRPYISTFTMGLFLIAWDFFACALIFMAYAYDQPGAYAWLGAFALAGDVFIIGLRFLPADEP